MSLTVPFDCPRCGSALATSERQGVEIGRCPQCRGVWLDRGAVDKLVERSDTPPPISGGGGLMERVAPGAWSHPPEPPQQQPWGGLHQVPKHAHHGKRQTSWLAEIFD